MMTQEAKKNEVEEKEEGLLVKYIFFYFVKLCMKVCL